MPAFLSRQAPSTLAAGALNRLMARESWALARLQPHAGKTVCLALGPTRIHLAIASAGRLEACDDSIVPDVSVTLPAERLGQVPAALRKPGHEGLTALLHIQGDAALAQVISGLAQDLRWDMEHELAGKIGDIPALRVLRTVSFVRKGLRRSRLHMGANVAEYLIHEARLMAARPGFSDWEESLQQASRRLDRLEARVNALAQRKQRHA